MKIDCIIIAIPERFWKEYPGGMDMFKRVMAAIDQAEGEITWLNTISAIPKQEVKFVYFCYHGKIQMRLTVVEFERNVSRSWEGNNGDRNFPNKNWVILCGPVAWADRDIPMKGFQGFRYTEFLF